MLRGRSTFRSSPGPVTVNVTEGRGSRNRQFRTAATSAPSWGCNAARVAKLAATPTASIVSVSAEKSRAPSCGRSSSSMTSGGSSSLMLVILTSHRRRDPFPDRETQLTQ